MDRLNNRLIQLKKKKISFFLFYIFCSIHSQIKDYERTIKYLRQNKKSPDILDSS